MVREERGKGDTAHGSSRGGGGGSSGGGLEVRGSRGAEAQMCGGGGSMVVDMCSRQLAFSFLHYVTIHDVDWRLMVHVGRSSVSCYVLVVFDQRVFAAANESPPLSQRGGGLSIPYRCSC